jgi:mannose-1-phosphate guanylyltransferase
MAYKDEYEVARLFSDGAFQRQVEAAFEGELSYEFHLAPPLFAKPDPVTGEPRKMRFGPRMMKGFSWLARFKALRGTPLDIFGWSEERRTERALIKDYEKLVAAQMPYLKPDQILTEPIGRNTAPCVAYACQKIALKDPLANIVVSPADHVIANEPEFRRVISQALAYTEGKDILVTLGIQPSRPDTGYGYIQYLDGNDELRKVKTFTEKPELELAKRFIESGDFVWNAGIFICSASAINDAIRKYLPEMSEIFEEASKDFYTPAEKQAIDAAYSQCKNISIDYGIMEKSDKVYVLPAEFGWSDLGTWKSLYELAPHKDGKGNVVDGNAMIYDTSNSIVKVSSGKLIVVHGLDNFIVAENDDVIMICPKDDEQKVKAFVADTKAGQDKRFI